MRIWSRVAAVGVASIMWATSTYASVMSTIIVEFDGEPGAVYKAQNAYQNNDISDSQLEAYRAGLSLEQDNILAQMANSGIDFTVKTENVRDQNGVEVGEVSHRYTLVMNGATLLVPSDQVSTVRNFPGVKRVHRSILHQTMLDQSVSFIRAPELYGGVHELGPFDSLNEGYEGQGVNISVLDTGVEYWHEMFGGDATPPRLGLLPHSAAVPTNEKVNYFLPLLDGFVEDTFGHGTHVATTAAGYLGYSWGGDNIPGTADDVPVHGVAPQSKIQSYTICSAALSTLSSLGVPNPLGGCRGEVIVLALEDSVSPRTLTGFAKPISNVINMSLGAPNGNPLGASAIAASNAALAGAVVVAAAGNSGDVRSIVGSPSVGRHVISVAASTDPGGGGAWFVDVLDGASFSPLITGSQTPANQFPAANGEPQDTEVFAMSGTARPSEGGMAQYVAFVDGGLAAPLWPASVSGRIALVDGGGVATFAEAANNGAAAGAIAVLNISETETPTAVTAPIPAANIKRADADALIASMFNGNAAHGELSTLPLRLETSAVAFRADVAGFSSRGPVSDFGQIKPDLSAPGVDVLAGGSTASLLGVLGLLGEGGAPYYAISGTSMATPHVAGAAAQLVQAHPDWRPEEIRTAMLNTSTTMRDDQGNPDSYGSHNPSIHSQGAGLIDVAAAANTPAFMGVIGDGIEQPRILGSHSFGNVPVKNNLCVSNESVDIAIRDLTGAASTWTLRAENNRRTNEAGVTPTFSSTVINVPAGGEATFSAGLQFDSFAYSGTQAEEFQWYVVATNQNGTELSMPMFFRATDSVPGLGGGITVTTEYHDGSLDAGANAAGASTYADVPIEVANGTVRLVINLEADFIHEVNAAFPDLDMILYDPDGIQVGSSGNQGNIESIDASVSKAGTYVLTVENYLGGPTSFTAQVDHHQSPSADPVVMNDIMGEYVNGQGQSVDFDQSFELSWTAQGGETGFTVQRSINGSTWTDISGLLPASTTSYSVSNAAAGSHSYRVVSQYPGQICAYVSQPSAAVSVSVEPSVPVTLLLGEFDWRIISINTNNGIQTVEIALVNESGTDYRAPVDAYIELTDQQPGAQIINADTGGDGVSGPAVFMFGDQLADEAWDPNETSDVRRIEVDSNFGFFDFDIKVETWQKR